MTNELDPSWVRIGKLPGSRAKTAILQLAKTVDDPRLAGLYMTWLAQGNWPAPTAKIVWERILAHLVALKDGSVVGALEEHARNLPRYFVGAAHRAWLAGELGKAAHALAKAAPRTAPAVNKTAATPARDLAAPVWAEPDDDELRQVVADAMTEHGDPRGEFITLQRLARTTPAQRKRERALLDAHAKTWLGAIEKLALDGAWKFARGFPIEVGVNRRGVPRRAWEAALAAPEWATIRTLHVSILETPKWWITAWADRPDNRALAFEVGDIGYPRPAMRIERAKVGKPWLVTSTIRGYASSCVPILRAFAAAKVAVAIKPNAVAASTERALYGRALTT